MRVPEKKTRGSLVLLAFCLVAVIGIALASYFNACQQALNHSTREYQNRQARYLAEVGLEEALWQLNNSMTWIGSGPTSSTAWAGTGTVLDPYALSVTNYTLGSGATGTLSVTVNTTNYQIRSTATVSAAGKIYTKTLTATTQYAPQFGNAVASASGTVSFSVDGTVDSYNSSTAAYAAPSSSAGFAAVVAGNNVTLSSASVMGYVMTYGNTPSYSGSATVKAYGSPASPNVVTTRVGASAYVPIFSVITPTIVTTLPGTASAGTITLSAVTPPIGSAGTTTYHGTTVANPNYRVSRNLTINGDVKMVVRGDLTVDTTRQIIVSANSSLELFVAGNMTMSSTSARFTNNSVNAVPTISPGRIAVYLTGATSSLTWASSTAFYGVIFIPNSTANPVMTVSSAGMQFYGAIVAKGDISFSGGLPRIHYDSALRASSWKYYFTSLNAPFSITAVTESATER